MNDPNGLVYYAGTWHLFYQYYPDSTVWGPMHWGHATSRDLVQWEPQPVALAPDSLGYIFSGSAVVDSTNSSGLGSAGNPPLVAMFTYHDMAAEKAGSRRVESQAIAFSLDSGRTWQKYAGNPVIPNPGDVKDFRDPKLVRDAARDRWIVTLAVGDHAEFWGSRDLKSWTKLSAFGAGVGNHGGVWECPDFRPMRVEGSGETKWVLIQNINPGHPNGGSGTQYFVGDFDGTTFTLDPRFAADVRDGRGVWLDEGRDDYAGVTWANAPNGRVVFLGWMSNWSYAQQVPTARWRSAMTVPRELSLQLTPRGYRIASRPVKELEALRGEPHYVDAERLKRNARVDRPVVAGSAHDGSGAGHAHPLGIRVAGRTRAAERGGGTLSRGIRRRGPPVLQRSDSGWEARLLPRLRDAYQHRSPYGGGRYGTDARPRRRGVDGAVRRRWHDDDDRDLLSIDAIRSRGALQRWRRGPTARRDRVEAGAVNRGPYRPNIVSSRPTARPTSRWCSHPGTVARAERTPSIEVSGAQHGMFDRTR